MHFVGIGGAGMSGIARILLARGVAGLRQRRARLRRAGRAAALGRDRARRPRRRARRRRRHRRGVHGGPRRPTRRWSRRAGRPRACCPAPRRWPRDARPARGRGRRHARQDHDDVDAHGRAAALRRRPVVRDRRRAQRGRRQRAPRARRHLRRRGRRERRLVPRLPPLRRDRHERRARPPRPLRHRRGRRAGVRTRSSDASHRTACSSPAPTTRVARALARAGRGAGHRRCAPTGTADDADVRVVDSRCIGAGLSFEVVDAPAAGWGSRHAAGAGPAQRAQRRAAFAAGLGLGMPAADLRRRAGRVRRHPAPVRARATAAASGSSTTTPTTRPRCGGAGRRAHGRRRPGRVVAVLPAAPLQPHADLRRPSSARRSAWPTRSSSWTCTPRGRTRSPASPVRSVADAVPLPAERCVFVPSWSAVPRELAARRRPRRPRAHVGAGDVTLLGPEVLEVLAGPAGGAAVTRPHRDAPRLERGPPRCRRRRRSGSPSAAGAAPCTVRWVVGVLLVVALVVRCRLARGLVAAARCRHVG